MKTATAALRPPSQVMRLARMGSFHQTRLSFMRALLRSLKRERWRFERLRWRVDARGTGLALYCAHGPRHRYTLVCFAHDLPAGQRSDRVIAEAWDATFVLYDGIPDEREIARLAHNVPKQEAGSYRQSEVVLSRANRSVRVFSQLVRCLAGGVQPDLELIERSGYLMRTTAVYGNGKFGLSDRERIAGRPEFGAPFRAELLSVYLIRWFTVDLAEHLAHAANPDRAVKLDRGLARRLGVGNATGLGMAPFLVLHPALIHRWIHARETALARVRALTAARPAARVQFGQLLERMRAGLAHWHTGDRRQQRRIETLKADLGKIAERIGNRNGRRALEQTAPWEQLINWSQRALSMEGQELLVTLVLEPHGELIDDLAEQMAIDESRHDGIHGDQTAAELIDAVETNYRWALSTDYADPAQCARFWYVSEEKLEPRLGERFEEDGADLELPLSIGRDIAALHADLGAADPAQPVAEFLLTHPQHRHAVRRIQLTARFPYAEIRDNLISARLRPIDLLRCKLSFFGANQFDPKSDRWVRITMYQHAPFPVVGVHARQFVRERRVLIHGDS
ncbi:MAG: hypothetical protein OXU22_01405, partial [Gammaproteobacteria bacterium]|nr:hypothetical protein [Gammaproteobacteria bacterium]